jgi:uncharacterized protein (TIGR00369 family)
MAEEIRYGVARPGDIAGLTGREVLLGILEGRLPAPPMARLMRFRMAEVGEGRVVVEGDPDPGFCNPMGVVHGGWALTLLDTVTGCAAHSTLPAGTGYTTLETKGNFTRAITPSTGIVRAEGKVVAQGRKVITAEGWLRAADGTLLAHGTSTLLVLAGG